MASTIRSKAVPIFHKDFRVWNKIDNWCSLCKEPFGQWNEHRGKRDHLCLELFFDTVLDYDRTWAPGTTWVDSKSRFHQATLEKLFKWHDDQERDRRESVFHMLRYLRDEGVIVPGPARWKEHSVARIGAGQQGAMVMFRWMHPHILHVFPNADAKQISAFSQMCASMYNLETTFDVCGLKDLLLPGDVAPTPTGETEVSYADKAFIVRHLLGQLRWAMDTDVAVPRYHSIAWSCPPHLALLAEKAGHGLITDMIFCRVCEYVSRVEYVWREQTEGFDRNGTHLHRGKLDPRILEKPWVNPLPRALTETTRTIVHGQLEGNRWST